jgi:hypothetical protein
MMQVKRPSQLDFRLGLNGADEVKRHPFFKGINWNTMKNHDPPFIPNVKIE